jgi:hypothetical protein
MNCRFERALRVLLLLWIGAPLAIVLPQSVISKTIAASDRAQIWMMASALFVWCLFSVLLLLACKRVNFEDRVIPKHSALRVGIFTGLATGLALIEEVCTQFMTEHASFFGVASGQAYITPSLDYCDTVLHHSVIVFVSMFAVCAMLAERWKFSPKEIFFLVGITGLTAEMTMNPASLFMGFWLLVYGFMVMVPGMWLYQVRQPVKRQWWHYPMSVILMLLGGLAASVVVHATFPHHPDNHFRAGAHERLKTATTNGGMVS